jgi:hypothetical protein
MIIISASRHLENWYQDLRDNYPVRVAESGYSNDKLGLEWIKHFDRYPDDWRVSTSYI